MSNRADRRREASLSRKAQKQRDRPNKNEQGPFYFKDPFADVPREQFRAAALSASVAARERLPDALAKAILAAEKCEPLYFLGAMTRAVLTASVTENGRIESYKHERWEKAIKHFHVEWAQALFLCSTTPEITTKSDIVQSISPQAIMALSDALYDLGNDYQMSRLAHIEQVPEDLRPFAMLQERIRLHTVIVRNWGYYESAILTIRAIFSGLSADLVANIGFDVTQICNLFDFLLRRTERILNENFDRLRSVASAKTAQQLFQKYSEEFGDPDRESNSADLRLPTGWSRGDALAMVLAHNDLVLGEDLCFDAREIAEALDITSAAASELIHVFTLSRKAAGKVEANAIFLDNPIWKRPIMLVADDKFICPLPQLFFDNAFSISAGF